MFQRNFQVSLITFYLVINFSGGQILTYAEEQGLYATLSGHTKRVNTIQVTPDGKYIVTGGADSTIRIWDFKTLKCIRTITEQRNVILSIALAANGSYIISGGMESLGRVWDFKTGLLLRTLGGHSIEIRAVAYSKAKNYLATGSTDRTVLVWNFASGSCLKRITNKMPVIAMDFSPNGNYLATGGWEHKVQIWDLSYTDVNKTCYGHELSVRAVKFAPSGLILASGSEDRTIRIWNPLNANCLRIILAHDDFISDIVFAPNGKVLVSASFDKSIKIWDTYTWELVRTIQVSEAGVSSLAFTPDGKYVVSGNEAGNINIWIVEPINYAISVLQNQQKVELNALLAGHAGSPKGTNAAAKNVELKKRQIEDKYAPKIGELNTQKRKRIKESIRPITMKIDLPGKYDKSQHILELGIRNEIIMIKVPPYELKKFMAQWFNAKAHGTLQLGDDLLQYKYIFTSVEHPILDKNYRVIRQVSLQKK